MRPALPLLLALLACPALGQDQVWTWNDEKGEEHYTNDPGAIPEKFRARAKATQGDELSVLKTHPAPEQRPAPKPPDREPPARPSPNETGGPERAAPADEAPPRRAQGAIRVVLFESSTNSGSKALSRAGVIEKLVSNNPGLRLERVEFATAVERAEQLKVNQLPTVLFVDQTGTVVARTTGLVTLKALQAQLDKARGVQ